MNDLPRHQHSALVYQQGELTTLELTSWPYLSFKRLRPPGTLLSLTPLPCGLLGSLAALRERFGTNPDDAWVLGGDDLGAALALLETKKDPP